ncbi:MAG: hypothetical protein DI538_17565 [Azospira oryzae]|jgi:hypothetical protein|nr:MAG: hypothetical protein DI538_17565 [Azospira oryzae]
MQTQINTHTNVIIFKTNIETEQDLHKLASLLGTEPSIRKWTVDREDIDHVLRIESEGADEMTIKQSVEYAGFVCEDLDD